MEELFMAIHFSLFSCIFGNWNYDGLWASAVPFSVLTPKMMILKKSDTCGRKKWGLSDAASVGTIRGASLSCGGGVFLA
ncbi:MAG: hypothetical protein MI742_06395 [Desulfobacterales bacterium]|nr:hypothetical protein [Desulfobacterales bacterium]